MLRLSARRFLGIARILGRRMSSGSSKSYKSHEERTATEPRDPDLVDVTIDHIQPVHSTVRLFKLGLVDRQRGLKFRAGSWLDVHVPGLPKAGGFTITSSPYEASPAAACPQVELAIQYSPKNPPAAWLWKPMPEILNQKLQVRVGGSFTWPPATVDLQEIDHLILVAGGVGINPLISMLSHFFHQSSPRNVWSHIKVDMLYSTKLAPASSLENVLFLRRLRDLAERYPERLRLRLYLTDGPATSIPRSQQDPMRIYVERIDRNALNDILGTNPEERRKCLCYVCGPQQMTDELVHMLQSTSGVPPDHVLCEKWW